MSLEGKKILLGVSSSIAAYKAAELTSQLRQKGADVHVLMTPNAAKLVAPLTFEALSGNKVHIETFAAPEIEHIALADKADVFVVAPATANVIAKLACGIADDLLTTTALACRAPLIVAPAMETKMFEHPATQANLETLRQRGATIIEPEEGWLASGKMGKGRLASIDKIIAAIEAAVTNHESQITNHKSQITNHKSQITNHDLSGLHILVTAGATREPIDPVRFLSNRSSGKMGYALAQAAKERGAKVTLVSGHAEVTPPEGVEVIKVESAEDMVDAVLSRLNSVDVLICAAAIADFKPAKASTQKIKRAGKRKLTLELERTPDLLERARKRKPDMLLVGFAAETENLIENAKAKLKSKKLDLICANDVTREGAGFGSDTNIVTLISRDGKIEELPQMPKLSVAHAILDRVRSLLPESSKASRKEANIMSKSWQWIQEHYAELKQQYDGKTVIVCEGKVVKVFDDAVDPETINDAAEELCGDRDWAYIYVGWEEAEMIL